jgi:hypothetical protein
VAGVALSVQLLDMRWTFRGSNSGRDKIFCARPDRPWGLPTLPCNRYRFSFPGMKRPEHSVNHPHPI